MEYRENRPKKRMDDGVRERMKKLAIFSTRNFKPLMTHNELAPLMTTLGFVPSPPTQTDEPVGDFNGVWMEYVYSAACCFRHAADIPLPKPRLPYPNIDGLHICTYMTFWDAVNFYLRMGDDLSNIFHIRGMPVNGLNDRSKHWLLMEEENNSFYVYREGTVEQATYNLYNANKNVNATNKSIIPSRNKASNSVFIRGNNSAAGCRFVPLKDIIVENVNVPKLNKCKKENDHPGCETDE